MPSNFNDLPVLDTKRLAKILRLSEWPKEIVSERPPKNTPHSCDVNSRMVANSIRFDDEGIMHEQRCCTICDRVWEQLSDEGIW